jgi:hypothetical protein
MIIVNAEDAVRLMAELAAKHATLVAAVKVATIAAGREMASTAKGLAPHGPHTRGYANSIRSLVMKQSSDGIDVTVETTSPLGAIITFGTATSGPHDAFGPALEQGVPPWEAKLSEAAAAAL